MAVASMSRLLSTTGRLGRKSIRSRRGNSGCIREPKASQLLRHFARESRKLFGRARTPCGLNLHPLDSAEGPELVERARDPEPVERGGQVPRSTPGKQRGGCKLATDPGSEGRAGSPAVSWSNRPHPASRTASCSWRDQAIPPHHFAAAARRCER